MNKIKWIIMILVIFISSGCFKTNECQHTYELTTHIESTCTEKGLVEKTCSLCGNVAKIILALKDHSYGEEGIVVESTCALEGYTLKTCTVCWSEGKVNLTEKLPHEYEEEIVDSTCTELGYTLKTCTKCDFEEQTNFTEMKEHNYTQKVIKPSCVDQGYTIHTCIVCDGTKKTDYIHPIGHIFKDWVVTKEATDITDGIKERECKNCDYVETAVIFSEKLC